MSDKPWWYDVVFALFDKGEWKVLILALGLTFALTYILKLVYYAFTARRVHVRDSSHIRLIAVMAGFIVAFGIWKQATIISMDWWMAGIGLGPLSIAVHHLLIFWVSNKYPRLAFYLRGKNRRKYQVPYAPERDRRKQK